MFSEKDNDVMVICIISVVVTIGSLVFCCFVFYICSALKQKIDYLRCIDV